MERSMENPTTDRKGIVDSLRRGFLARTEDELHRQISRIGRQHQIAGAAFGSAHAQAVLHAEFDHKQRLLDHLMDSVGTTFPKIPLDHFKDAMLQVIDEEYAKISVTTGKSAMRARGRAPTSYTAQIQKRIEIAKGIVEDRCSISKAKLRMNRRTIFMSHAEEDAVTAKMIKTQVDNVFEKGLTVFVSSIPGVIPPGSDWLDTILANLMASDAFLVLVTRNSVEKPFVWFEIGFSWLRRQREECEMYIACVPPIDVGNLPEPLRRLQATSLSDKGGTQALFEGLIRQFGIGNLDTLELDKMCAAIEHTGA
jgi:hypothetical protein